MTRIDVPQLARLARLDVPDADAADLADQLARMLDEFALVDPGAEPDDDERTPLRDDEPSSSPGETVDAIRAAFPATANGALDVGSRR